MLKKDISIKLNEQLNLEFFSSNLYLQMSAWCQKNFLQGASKFFRLQSKEEMNHMLRLFDYLNDTNSMPILGKIEAPTVIFESFFDLIQISYNHEKMITEKINLLSHISMTFQDYSTFHLLQKYVEEQHKEEKIFKFIMDKFELIKSNLDYNYSLFFIDQELKNINN